MSLKKLALAAGVSLAALNNQHLGRQRLYRLQP